MSVPKYIRKLAASISDDRQIAAYASLKFEIDISADFVAKVRADEPAPRVAVALPEYQPISWSKPISVGPKGGYDPLARALFKYHAKRATGSAKAHWEALV